MDPSCPTGLLLSEGVSSQVHTVTSEQTTSGCRFLVDTWHGPSCVGKKPKTGTPYQARGGGRQAETSRGQVEERANTQRPTRSTKKRPRSCPTSSAPSATLHAGEVTRLNIAAWQTFLFGTLMRWPSRTCSLRVAGPCGFLGEQGCRTLGKEQTQNFPCSMTMPSTIYLKTWPPQQEQLEWAVRHESD